MNTNHNIFEFPVMCDGVVVGKIELEIKTVLMLEELMGRTLKDPYFKPFTISATFKPDSDSHSTELLDFTIET